MHDSSGVGTETILKLASVDSENPTTAQSFVDSSGVATETTGLKPGSLDADYPAKAEAFVAVEVVLEEELLKEEVPEEVFLHEEESERESKGVTKQYQGEILPCNTHTSSEERTPLSLITNEIIQDNQENQSDPDTPTSEIVVTRVFKKTSGTKCGLHFDKKPNGAIVVSKVVDDGLFSSTALEPGDELIHINYFPTLDMSARQARELLRRAEGEVRVCAKRASLATVYEGNLLPSLGASLTDEDEDYETMTHKSQYTIEEWDL